MFRTPTSPSSSSPHAPDGDAAIRSTDNDAALARLSAVQKHYLPDPYIRFFVPRAHLQPARPPLINVGTYVRSVAIDALVESFMGSADGSPVQIVSLGAGSDTRFWRIAAGEHAGRLAKYIEVDFPENTTKKAMAIKKNKDLAALVGEAKLVNGGMGLQSAMYHLLPADLRRPPAEALAALTSDIMSPSLPTLLLFECVLVYMTPAASSGLIQWFVDRFSAPDAAPLGGIVYEMFGLNDSFGTVMMSNLRVRNVTLPGAEPYPTVASLPARFAQHGFQHVGALTLKDIRQRYVEADELQRISQLEMLDEIEELELVLAHYAITWGVRTSGAPSPTWAGWSLKRQDQQEDED